MDKLEEFANWLNEDVGGEGKLPDLKHGSYGEAMGQSLARHYSEDRQKGGLRMSSMGKPASVIALEHLGYSEPEPRGKSRLIFHTGDMFENFLEVMLQTYGIEIISSQGEVSYKGIKGHYDYIVNLGGQHVVVEAKTMSANYAKQFKRGVNDVRGYLTQLSLYWSATMLPAVWVCLDKGTNEVFIVEPIEEEMYDALSRVDNILGRIDKINTIEDVFKQTQVPPARPEVYKGSETGRLLLPTSMSYSTYKHALYKLVDDYNGYGKFTTYVEDVADNNHMRENLDRMVENGELNYAK